MDEMIAGQWYQLASQLGIIAKGFIVFYVGLAVLVIALLGIQALIENKKE